MKSVLLLTRVDGDANGVGHVLQIAIEISESNTVKEILSYAKDFAGYRKNLDGIKMQIMELKTQEEEKCLGLN